MGKKRKNIHPGEQAWYDNMNRLIAAGIEVGREQIESRQRTACTVCGDSYEWYRLEPGSGRCTRCQP